MAQISTIAIANYRSILDLVLPLQRLNLITGANGCGKSNLYRSLRLLVDAANGQLISSIAVEGGLSSVLWAGPERLSSAMRRGEQPVQGSPRNEVVRLKLGFSSDELGYAVELGLPIPSRTAFHLDPQYKFETLFSGASIRRSSVLVSRDNAMVKSRGEGSSWHILAKHLQLQDSMLTHSLDPRLAPEMLVLRERVRGWRFYDNFRTDATAPIRRAQQGTRTPVLSHDGRDLAAAVQTLLEVGDAQAFDYFIDDAFPGCVVRVKTDNSLFELQMEQPGVLRPLRASELSDGTLRYLCLVAALLSPRPPEFLVLNEPETSLHTDLLAPLGGLIKAAAETSQVLVVSHAPALVRVLSAQAGCHSLLLRKQLGATEVEGFDDLTTPLWRWKP